MVNSCLKCPACEQGYENSCFQESTLTYSSTDPVEGNDTKGIYSSVMIAPEQLVLSIPKSLDLTHAVPLLCAGITTYSPLILWHVGPGKKVGVIGLGGLGYMTVKYANAMGAEMWVTTSSAEKTETAKFYGAAGVIISTSTEDMESAVNTFDFLLDTIPKAHNLSDYLTLLTIHGTICLVGPIEPIPCFHSGSLINGQKSIAGSGIGGIKETQEMLVYSAKHNILPEIELIKIENINEAWQKLADKKMVKRFVIDMKKSFQ